MFVLFSPLSKVDKWMLGFLHSKNGWAYGQWYFSNRKWKWSHSVMSNSLRPMNCSPPSSSIHGILQARILECVAISFSRGSSWPRDRTQVSHIAGKRLIIGNGIFFQLSSVIQLCPTLYDTMDCSMPSFPVHHQLPELTQTHVIESVMPSNHLILCCPLLLPPSIFPSISVFSTEIGLFIRWPKFWNLFQHQSFQWTLRNDFL